MKTNFGCSSWCKAWGEFVESSPCTDSGVYYKTVKVNTSWYTWKVSNFSIFGLNLLIMNGTFFGFPKIECLVFGNRPLGIAKSWPFPLRKWSKSIINETCIYLMFWLFRFEITRNYSPLLYKLFGKPEYHWIHCMHIA